MKAMDVGQRPGSEIQQKNHVERAIIMAAGTGTRMRRRRVRVQKDESLAEFP